MSSIAASADAELRCIVGPTGAGKSALALELAARVGAVIISADSRQIYRGFDLGTAKPTAEEQRRVLHFGLDIAEPGHRWSAAQWAREAEGWCANALAMGKAPLVVGGSGFWMQALVAPLFREPPLDPERRSLLQRWLDGCGTEQLRRWTQVLDPARADLGRTQLLRALEIALLSGRPISYWHRTDHAAARRVRWLVVDPGPVLQQRLAERIDAMLAAGWEEEVRRLLTRVPLDAPAWNACGYEEVAAVVRGEQSRPEAREAILVRTRQYAKRQRTWFRHQLQGLGPVTHIDPTHPEAAMRAELWWRGQDE